MSQRIQRLGISVGSGEATKVILAAQSGKRIRVLALLAITEANAADFALQDEDGNAITCVFHMGSGTGGQHHAEISMSFNPEGWCETPEGKGLKVTNNDSSDFEMQIVVAVTEY
jgi:hypothetical protein